jgi:hypothetical protein
MNLNIYQIKDINNIIENYKTNFELYENELKKITECINSEEYESKFEIPLLLEDFRDYYLKNKYINRIRFQIRCYNIERFDNTFWELDFNDEIDGNTLNGTKVLEIIKLENSNTIYLKMDFEQEKIKESEIIISDNSYLITESDDESDIEILISLV